MASASASMAFQIMIEQYFYSRANASKCQWCGFSSSFFIDYNFSCSGHQALAGPNQQRETDLFGNFNGFIGIGTPNTGYGMLLSFLTMWRTARGLPPNPMNRMRVPMILMPYFSSFSESLSAVCPPSWTITPSGFSCSMMSYKCSQNTGSKYSLSANIKISRNRFRITVHHDGFISHTLWRPTHHARMNNRTQCLGR